jgi:hypothetical protein
MATNIRWILEQEGASAKAVVWAHNTHVWVWNDASAPNAAMGSHLRRMFGSDMVAFGFAFNEGAFQSQEVAATPGRRLRAFEVSPAPAGSLDAVLASAGLEIAVIDLRTLPGFGPVNRWFATPRLTRCCIGASTAINWPVHSLSLRWCRVSMTDWCSCAGPRPHVRSRSQIYRGRNWRSQPIQISSRAKPATFLPSFRRYDFDIGTTDSQCHSGTRCAVISRAPGEHYGEVAGTLTQSIDATPYRGKQVTLRAATRAQQKGADNRSWVTLSVAKQAAGRPAVTFEALRPVVSSRWKTLQVRAAVPNDAETITFGLVLVGNGKAWLDSIVMTATDSAAGNTRPPEDQRPAVCVSC